MSHIDHAAERERISQQIAECQVLIDECRNPTTCPTCRKLVDHIAELRAQCEALDHDEDQKEPSKPIITLFVDDSQAYEMVPEGAYLHPGDEVYNNDECQWSVIPSFEWGVTRHSCMRYRRHRVLDIDLPSLLAKAHKLAATLDPVNREKLLYCVSQAKSAIATIVTQTIKEASNANNAR